MLTPQQVKQFQNEGWLFLPETFLEEAAYGVRSLGKLR